MTRYQFRKHQHLRSSSDFARVYERRCRAGDASLLLFAARNDLPYTRIGLSVSRKQGNAVRRARLKRLLREAFRLSQHELPTGLDLILIPRAGTEVSLAEYRESLVRLARQAARRLGPRDRSKTSSQPPSVS